jgi:putative MATE family efflux protein
VLRFLYPNIRARKKNIVNEYAGQAFFLAFSISIIFSILGYFLSPIIVSLFGVEPGVFVGATSYLKISFIGQIFVFGFLVYQSMMRGAGNAKTPMYIVLATVLLNFLLDPLFIFGKGFIPGFGVSGAAIATVSTQAVALIAGLILMRKKDSEIHLKAKDFKPKWTIIKRIFKIGFPLSLEQSSRAIGFIIMTAIVSTFGTIALASYGIGTRLLSLVIIPAISLSISVSTLVGQNIGAGKIDRADKTAKLGINIGFWALLIVSIVFFVFSKQIVTLFIPGDTAVIQGGTLFVKIISATFPLIGVQMAIFGSFRGSGNTGLTLKLALITLLAQVSSALILSRYTSLGEIGIWWAFPISNAIGFTISVTIFLRGKWKEKVIIDN